MIIKSVFLNELNNVFTYTMTRLHINTTLIRLTLVLNNPSPLLHWYIGPHFPNKSIKLTKTIFFSFNSLYELYILCTTKEVVFIQVILVTLTSDAPFSLKSSIEQHKQQAIFWNYIEVISIVIMNK